MPDGNRTASRQAGIAGQAVAAAEAARYVRGPATGHDSGRAEHDLACGSGRQAGTGRAG
jgi:hypothetical protein